MIGWDIGGAHVKFVQLDAQGCVLAAAQLPCPLWLGLNELEKVLNLAILRFNLQADQHVVTMTGELVDGFKNRRTGVLAISRLMQQFFGRKISFYAGAKGFVQQPSLFWREIASANWHASADALAKMLPNALLMDIGSTTTDLMSIISNALVCKGVDDASRMHAGELVYAGVVRTPLMALAKSVIWREEHTPLMAEYFATTGDIYRLTGEISAQNWQGNTADAQPKTIAACARRLARMVGLDAENFTLNAWVELAESFKKQQLNDFEMAIFNQTKQYEILKHAPLVGMGAGEFLVRQLANRCGLDFVSVGDLICAKNTRLRRQASLCFPAYAVAKLAQSL